MKQRVKQFLKNSYVRIRYYHIGKRKADQRMLLFVIGKGYPQRHPGFVDRLKAIVSIYYIAQENGYPFKLACSSPFPLEEYLEPNQVNWRAADNEISYCVKNTRLITYVPGNGVPLLKSDTDQYHCYYYEGLNVWKSMGIKEWGKLWGEAYHKLFRPGPRLKELLGQALPEEKFIAVHIRFVNALEKFEKGFGSPINETQQKYLIEKCVECIKSISDREKQKVYVFSDSRRFLGIIGRMGISHLEAGNIGHVSFQKEREVYEKTLIDFFAMAASEAIYSVRGIHLYNSAFPEYAAIVGGKECRIARLKEKIE